MGDAFIDNNQLISAAKKASLDLVTGEDKTERELQQLKKESDAIEQETRTFEDDVHQKIIESSIDELLNKYPTTKNKKIKNCVAKRGVSIEAKATPLQSMPSAMGLATPNTPSANKANTG